MAKFMENKHPQDLVNLALAVLLFISPWVLGFSMDRNPAGNAWISAIVIAALAIGALGLGLRRHRPSCHVGACCAGPAGGRGRGMGDLGSEASAARGYLTTSLRT